MQTVLVILITLLMFGILILIHEFGHYITARWAKVKINEFAIGMGPAIFKWKRKDIQYSLRAFPIGGFVQMDGEDGNGTDENSFNNKPKWKRFVILAAGAFNNMVFGFVMICLVYGLLAGIKLYPTTIVAEFQNDAISQQSGLQKDDRIYSIDGYKIYTYTDLSYACTKNGTEPLDIMVIRNQQKVLLNDVKFPTEANELTGEMNTLDFKVYGAKKTFGSTISYSFNCMISLSRSIYSFLGTLITGRANLNNVSGPVGTTRIVGTAVSKGFNIDFASLFLMMAMISINLGVMNLLPFPALDGGRIFILLFEVIFRRKLNEKFEVIVNTVGFVILMLFMVFITLKDILNLF